MCPKTKMKRIIPPPILRLDEETKTDVENPSSLLESPAWRSG
jgi:hypothetical protein